MPTQHTKLCFVFKVHYESNGRHIAQVMASTSDGVALGTLRKYTKVKIFKLIDDGCRAMTMVKTNKDDVVGENILAYSIDGRRYIKTSANSKEEDNLGNLPTF